MEQGRERVRRFDGERARARRTASSRVFFSIADNSRRRRNTINTTWGCDKAVYNQATPFYFTNFPEDWKYEEMWGTFMKLGRVLAIYCPNRRDKKWNRFGFVRFIGVQKEVQLERRLNEIQIGEFTIKANKPLYNDPGQERRSERILIQRQATEHNRSYAEVLKGNEYNAKEKTGYEIENMRPDGRRQVW